MTDELPILEFQTTGRFAVQRQLGAGGMGVVFKAYDREREEVVAVKTMRHADAEAIYRFKREFRLLADFAHQNMVRLYELFSYEGKLFFTMEYVDGVDFVEYVRSTRALGDREASPGKAVDTKSSFRISSVDAILNGKELLQDVGAAPEAGGTPDTAQGLLPAQERRLRVALRQLVQGTAALHAAGLVHRDIKPSNVLVTTEGRVVVLDFGLVTKLYRHDHSLTESQQIAGTALYMSPEQAAGEEVSPASDWYSVGDDRRA